MTPDIVISKALTIAFNESLLEPSNRLHKEETIKIVSELKVTEGPVGVLATVVHDLYSQEMGATTKDELQSTVDLACGMDSADLAEAISTMLTDSPDDVGKRSSQITRDVAYIRRMSAMTELREALSDGYYIMEAYGADPTTVMEKMTEHIMKLEGLIDKGDIGDKLIVDECDLGDLDKIEELMTTVKDQMSGKSVWKTGWVFFNDMMGGFGIKFGSFAMISALPFRNKTGFTLSLFRHLCTYNAPILPEGHEFKTPRDAKQLMIRFSAEDDLDDNIKYMYKDIMLNIHGKTVDLSKVSIKKAAKLIQETYEKTGFHVKLIRVNPSNTTYKDIIILIQRQEALGYDVRLIMFDYLAMITTQGCDRSGPMGADLQDMFKRVRNYFSAKNITFITPHQLSSTALRRLDDDLTDRTFLNNIYESGYYKGCSTLHQEPDIEIFVHIIAADTGSYLHVRRGKLRGGDAIPESHKSYYAKFPVVGPIMDDNSKALKKGETNNYRSIPLADINKLSDNFTPVDPMDTLDKIKEINDKKISKEEKIKQLSNSVGAPDNKDAAIL